MAQQQPHPCHQLAQQHLAYLSQQALPQQIRHQSQTHLEHNPWAAEAALEAHLVQRPAVLVHQQRV